VLDLRRIADPAGIATGLACGFPPAAEKIFSARSQWLFWKTCVVIAAKAEDFGTGTMLTVPRSWWVLKSVTPNSFAYEFSPYSSEGFPPGTVSPWCRALVVGNEQRTVRRVQHNRARRIADRDHAQDGLRPQF
jgi:hypothetical protein